MSIPPVQRSSSRVEYLASFYSSRENYQISIIKLQSLEWIEGNCRLLIYERLFEISEIQLTKQNSLSDLIQCWKQFAVDRVLNSWDFYEKYYGGSQNSLNEEEKSPKTLQLKQYYTACTYYCRGSKIVNYSNKEILEILKNFGLYFFSGRY